jgi:hypothetical protein
MSQTYNERGRPQSAQQRGLAARNKFHYLNAVEFSQLANRMGCGSENKQRRGFIEFSAGLEVVPTKHCVLGYPSAELSKLGLNNKDERCTDWMRRRIRSICKTGCGSFPLIACYPVRPQDFILRGPVPSLRDSGLFALSDPALPCRALIVASLRDWLRFCR